MMRRLHINMNTTVEKNKLLKTLKENLARHREIVAQSRAGYVEKAKAALNARLDKLASGEVAELVFALRAPQDYSEAYETVIQMLEWSTQPHVELQADEFRHLVMDEWDWLQEFLTTNSAYSSAAVEYATLKGL